MATGASTDPKFADLKTPLYERARDLAELDEMLVSTISVDQPPCKKAVERVLNSAYRPSQER
jgi:hypothetical protein